MCRFLSKWSANSVLNAGLPSDSQSPNNICTNINDTILRTKINKIQLIILTINPASNKYFFSLIWSHILESIYIKIDAEMRNAAQDILTAVTPSTNFTT